MESSGVYWLVLLTVLNIICPWSLRYSENKLGRIHQKSTIQDKHTRMSFYQINFQNQKQNQALFVCVWVLFFIAFGVSGLSFYSRKLLSHSWIFLYRIQIQITFNSISWSKWPIRLLSAAKKGHGLWCIFYPVSPWILGPFYGYRIGLELGALLGGFLTRVEPYL